MFADWVAHGAEIGITAFFAIVVFVAFGAAVVALLGIGAKVFTSGKKEGSERW